MSRKTRSISKDEQSKANDAVEVAIVLRTYMPAWADLGAANRKHIDNLIENLQSGQNTAGQNIEKIRNTGFVSVRANLDIRVIAQYVGKNLKLHYVGHHDDAYRWVEKHKLSSQSDDVLIHAFKPEDETALLEVLTDLSQSKSEYGQFVFNKLVKGGFPTYVAKSLETVQSEEDLCERIDKLPQNLSDAVSNAVFYDIFDKTLGSGGPIKPPVTPPIAGDLRVERVAKPNSTMWLLQIYDGDTLIGSYERSTTESGAKEKESEILWPDRPDLRKIAADELRKAYAKNGDKPFVVRWAGKAIGQDGKTGVKQIRNEETGEILGEFPRSCFRK